MILGKSLLEPPVMSKKTRYLTLQSIYRIAHFILAELPPCLGIKTRTLQYTTDISKNISGINVIQSEIKNLSKLSDNFQKTIALFIVT